MVRSLRPALQCTGSRIAGASNPQGHGSMTSTRRHLYSNLVAVLLLAAGVFITTAQSGAAAPDVGIETTVTNAQAAAQLFVDASGQVERLHGVVEYLAGDDCNGRRTGTPGADNAAAG